MLSYIDLHCDTAYELYHRTTTLTAGQTAVSLPVPYERYAQFFAIWSDRRLDDEACYQDFLAIADDFVRGLQDPAVASRMTLVTTGAQLEHAWQAGRHAAILAVEDARLLGNDLSRLDILYEKGVRYLTLTWGGESCIGGSWDTDAGLTEFGRQVVADCFERGVLVDISHASLRTADQVLTLAEQAGKPVIASHANAYAVYPHARNLRDDQIRRLIATGGVVGLNLCAYHITDCERHHATPEDLLPHIDHLLSLGGEHHIVMGGDLDGAPLPAGIENVSDLPILASCMTKHGYSQELIRNIFYENARRFLMRAL